MTRTYHLTLHTALAVDKRPRVGKRIAASTPPEFRDLLISIARSAGGAHE